jgi:diguanylate cyclase (GGDEF)-like protein
MLKLKILSFFFIFNAIINISIAASNEINDSQIITETKEFTLNEKIVKLVGVSTESPIQSSKLMQRIKAENLTLNYAEHYLVLLVKAKIKQHEKEHADVILLIEQAKLLRKYIDEKQLDSPVFSEAFLVLANSYAAVKDFDNAYKNKKDYVDDYNDFSDAKRENTVDELTTKYAIAHKNEANKLLENQNKLKALRIGDVHRQQEDQQKKFLLIFCAILLFILLFLRQLKVRRKLIILAQTDSLTGLMNRETLFKKGQQLVHDACEHELDLSILLFDIDHFKKINDKFGHSHGDLVLEKMALLVNETMRSRDIFARLGGEEFVAILPGTDLEQAKAIAMRVMEKIVQHDFSEQGIDSNITISIGVANIKNTQDEFDDILHAADLAMYQAKPLRRNQMVSYDSIAKERERRHL